MSSVVADDPLRQIAGALAAACDSASRCSGARTGRQRATVKGPSSTTSGTSRRAPNNRTENAVSWENQANEADSSSPSGVSLSHTAAPNGSRRTAGTDR